MVYSFDDFKIIKETKLAQCCGAGMFGSDIYGVCIYCEGGSGSGFWLNIYQITKREFEAYPHNAWTLSRRFGYCDGQLLCSNYNGKGRTAYSFEVTDGHIRIL